MQFDTLYIMYFSGFMLWRIFKFLSHSPVCELNPIFRILTRFLFFSDKIQPTFITNNAEFQWWKNVFCSFRAYWFFTKGKVCKKRLIIIFLQKSTYSVPLNLHFTIYFLTSYLNDLSLVITLYIFGNSLYNLIHIYSVSWWVRLNLHLEITKLSIRLVLLRFYPLSKYSWCVRTNITHLKINNQALLSNYWPLTNRNMFLSFFF